MADGLNQARAVRVAEIINDYRTLLLHISEQAVEVHPDEYYDEGFVVLRECLAAAQNLMSANYQSSAMSGQGGSAETEKAELQRVLLDSSARRFQAHKIYLRAAAARRWTITRANILHGQRPSAQHTPALGDARITLQQELAQITDHHVASDLRAVDLRAGYWLDEDPSLDLIRLWIQGR